MKRYDKLYQDDSNWFDSTEGLAFHICQGRAREHIWTAYRRWEEIDTTSSKTCFKSIKNKGWAFVFYSHKNRWRKNNFLLDLYVGWILQTEKDSVEFLVFLCVVSSSKKYIVFFWLSEKIACNKFSESYLNQKR